MLKEIFYLESSEKAKLDLRIRRLSVRSSKGITDFINLDEFGL